jgi:hypothetical protein
MKNPKSEIRNPNEARSANFEDGARRARNVLECGGPPPFSQYGGHPAADQSARGLAHSKTWRNFAASLLFLVGATVAHAQSYSIDWFKVSGGGGMNSTGGVYSVSGTIGQHDAGGPMTGGTFSLTGGFWALYAVQIPGAPPLSIFLTTTNTAVVRWPFPSTGWRLQQNTNVATTNWVTPLETVNNDGTNNFIIVNPPAGNKFYRLRNL